MDYNVDVKCSGPIGFRALVTWYWPSLLVTKYKMSVLVSRPKGQASAQSGLQHKGTYLLSQAHQILHLHINPNPTAHCIT